ncbi:sigma factor-like helix-turn-helix DNA-binding protein [Microvirga sp. KLBC 81]|uniref:sigma factor-like helix-turn-helix DNA-binding protein n=1 Tax=Microvirga sp. KLBC 81 TaxID=1862707 RepID=UPI001FE12325|nr:sigma factor-like helix-turn-helix DNA-binding protein [Microvirga sp. KLBC 81]
MTTLKEFEDALREQGMHMALAILEKLRERDRVTRSVAPARRIAGRKMTPELARRILELHATTEMTQQEIAFELGVNQGRVNEVIKRGKWLSEDPEAPEAVARDRAKARMTRATARNTSKGQKTNAASFSGAKKRKNGASPNQAQLILGDL